MKIVLLMDNPTVPTGYASTCRLTAKELMKRGHKVYAMAFNSFPIDAPQDWYGVTLIPNYAKDKDTHAIYGDAETLMRVEREYSPDIYMLHNDSYRYHWVHQLPPDIHAKCVFWLPSEAEEMDTAGAELFKKLAATRFVTHMATHLHEPAAKGKDFGYIPHAVDLDDFFPPEDKRAAKASLKMGDKPVGLENKFCVVRVDRHQPRKMWKKTLEAFAKFAAGKDDVYLLGKCQPNDEAMRGEDDLVEITARLGIQDKVHLFSPMVSGRGIATGFYDRADVFFTTTSGEGFGLTVVEAMACGVPIVCPRVPVLPEVVGDAGIFFNASGKEFYKPLGTHYNISDTDDAARALNEAYADWKNGGEMLVAMGMKARERVEQNYSPTRVYDAWDKVFTEVASKSSLVSIITLLYNTTGAPGLEGPGSIGRLAETMRANVKWPIEWIIVDNGSPSRDATREWMFEAAKKDPRIKLSCGVTNMGFAGGCNLGIAQAKGQWIMLLNPDCEAVPPAKHGLTTDFVEMMVGKARSDRRLGIVGAQLNKRDDVLPGLKFPYFFNVLLTRDCLEAVKLADGKWLDEAFWPAYYEDADLTLRALSKGFGMAELPSIPFMHSGNETGKHVKDGGKDNPNLSHFRESIAYLEKFNPGMADFPRKRGELETGGVEGMISGNMAYLNQKWGPDARSKVKLVWHARQDTALAQVAEGLIPELSKLGFDVYSNVQGTKLPAVLETNVKYRKALEEGVDLSAMINVAALPVGEASNVHGGFRVGVAMAESTLVGKAKFDEYRSMDALVAFSEFTKGAVQRSGVSKPVTVIPPGVSSSYMESYDRYTGLEDEFSFLTVAGKADPRKDLERLVLTFCEAFPKDRDFPEECGPGYPRKCGTVSLVIKSDAPLEWIKSKGYDLRANIRVVSNRLSNKEMYDLYCQCDCLVQASRGEGLGLPVLEAAATGMATIYPAWGTWAEVMTPDASYRCSLSSNGDSMIAAPDGMGEWSNINIGHLKFLMHNAAMSPEETRDVGRRATAFAKKAFDWASSAAALSPVVMEWERQRKSMAGSDEFDPATFVRPTMKPVVPGDRVVIDVATRDRRPYLAALIVSLLGQTFKDWDLLVQVDDEDDSIVSDPLISSLCDRVRAEGHGCLLNRSFKQGPHVAHDRTLRVAAASKTPEYKLVCRIDDDIILKPEYLSNLFSEFLKDESCSVAAVGGVYLNPREPDCNQMAPKGWERDIHYAGRLDCNVMNPYVCIYPEGTAPRQMEHLYSSFMYRVEPAIAVGGYCLQLSPIGFREESDFSCRFHMAGYKLLLHPGAIGYHFAAPSGGVRYRTDADKRALAQADNAIYERRLAKWKNGMAAKTQRLGKVEECIESIKLTQKPTPQAPKNEFVEAAPPGSKPIYTIGHKLLGYMSKGKLYKTRECEEIKIEDIMKVVPVPSSSPEVNLELNVTVKGPDEAVATVSTVTEVPKNEPRGNVLVVINGGEDLGRLRAAADRYWSYGDVYVSSPNPGAKEHLKDLASMVACTTDEIVALTMAMIKESDHEFVMNITDTTMFMGNPTTLLSPDYDDYVFETFETYIPGVCLSGRQSSKTIPNGPSNFEQNESLGTMIGPEVRNQCLLYRRRPNATPSLERTYFADMIVLDDVRKTPKPSNRLGSFGTDGRGNELLPLMGMANRTWTKICTYQFPEGPLEPYRSIEMKPERVKASIIVTTTGRQMMLKKCLDSIYSHTTTTDFEAIVVNDGAQDNTVEYVHLAMASRPNFVFVNKQTNEGYAAALNAGIARAKGEYVVFMDDDCWIEGMELDGREWLERYIEALEKDPKLGFVSPLISEASLPQCQTASFYCVAMRKSTLDLVGPMDQLSFRNYMVDADYCFRAKKFGFGVASVNVRVNHLGLGAIQDATNDLLAASIKLREKWAPRKEIEVPVQNP